MKRLSNIKIPKILFVAALLLIWCALICGLISFEIVTTATYYDEFALLYAIDKSGCEVTELEGILSLNAAQYSTLETLISKNSDKEADFYSDFLLIEAFITKLDAEKTSKLFYEYANCGDITPTEKLALISEYGLTDPECAIKRLSELPVVKLFSERKTDFLSEFRKSLKSSDLSLADYKKAVLYAQGIFTEADSSIGSEKTEYLLKYLTTIARGEINLDDHAKKIDAMFSLRDFLGIAFSDGIAVNQIVTIAKSVAYACGESDFASVLEEINLKSIVFLEEFIGGLDEDKTYEFIWDFDYYVAHETYAKIAVDFAKFSLPIYDSYAPSSQKEVANAFSEVVNYIKKSRITSESLISFARNISEYNTREMSNSELQTVDALIDELF